MRKFLLLSVFLAGCTLPPPPSNPAREAMADYSARIGEDFLKEAESLQSSDTAKQSFDRLMKRWEVSHTEGMLPFVQRLDRSLSGSQWDVAYARGLYRKIGRELVGQDRVTPPDDGGREPLSQPRAGGDR